MLRNLLQFRVIPRVSKIVFENLIIVNKEHKFLVIKRALRKYRQETGMIEERVHKMNRPF